MCTRFYDRERLIAELAECGDAASQRLRVQEISYLSSALEEVKRARGRCESYAAQKVAAERELSLAAEEYDESVQRLREAKEKFVSEHKECCRLNSILESSDKDGFLSLFDERRVDFRRQVNALSETGLRCDFYGALSREKLKEHGELVTKVCELRRMLAGAELRLSKLGDWNKNFDDLEGKLSALKAPVSPRILAAYRSSMRAPDSPVPTVDGASPVRVGKSPIRVGKSPVAPGAPLKRKLSCLDVSLDGPSEPLEPLEPSEPLEPLKLARLF